MVLIGYFICRLAEVIHFSHKTQIQANKNFINPCTCTKSHIWLFMTAKQTRQISEEIIALSKTDRHDYVVGWWYDATPRGAWINILKEYKNSHLSKIKNQNETKIFKFKVNNSNLVQCTAINYKTFERKRDAYSAVVFVIGYICLCDRTKFKDYEGCKRRTWVTLWTKSDGLYFMLW